MTFRPGASIVAGMALLAMLLFAIPPTFATPSDTLQYRVRAAFLFNFSRFTDWPREHLEARSHFDFCVIGDPDLAAATELSVRGKVMHGRPARVSLPASSAAAGSCDLLYLAEPLEEWTAAVAGRPVLLVGEGRDFARRIGAVGFVLADNRLRFAINPSAAQGAGLQISSRLLELADIVSPDAD